MPDINCKQCGEPWEIYSLRHEVPSWDDQPEDAYEKVMRGEGCPACNWGEDADETGLGRTMDKEELDQRHYESLFNTDDDPVKFL